MSMSKGKNISDRALAGAAKAYKADPTLAARLAEAMSKATRKTYWRQEVANWLRLRNEPQLGAGLLLLETFRKLEGEQ